MALRPTHTQHLHHVPLAPRHRVTVLRVNLRVRGARVCQVLLYTLMSAVVLKRLCVGPCGVNNGLEGWYAHTHNPTNCAAGQRLLACKLV